MPKSGLTLDPAAERAKDTRSARASRPSVPRAPRWLGEEARALWRRLALDLHRAGLLTPLDEGTLAAYCDLAGQVHRARELLEGALLLKGRRDGLVINPAWRIYRDGLVLLRLYGTDLGLSPASRSHLPSVATSA